MADKLTPQQAQAVHDRGGVLLVSAAAGSGKTKVLVDRLMTYLTDASDPANLDDFLIITYTKAAASELRGKIAAKLTQRLALEPENRHLQRQIQRLFLAKISTVHGFCAELLRDNAYRLDLAADFRVADENECRELRDRVLADLLERAYARLETDEDLRCFVDTQGIGRDDRQVPVIVEKVYDSARCHLNPQKWLEECLAMDCLDPAADAAQTPWGRYLMEELFDYLDQQIRVLSRCAQASDACDGFAKASMNLHDTLHQLKHLRESTTWDEVVGRSGIDYGRLSFPTKNNPDPQLSETIKAARNACKKGLAKKLQPFSDSSQQVMEDLMQSAGGARGLVSLVKQFEKDYASAKRSRRCLDFSDLEHKTLDLLLGKSRSTPTAAAAEIAKRYREILVDEYQDSNGVQDAIFSALSARRNNCFLVGDVKQSIYQFRLADPGIFLEKYHRFAPAAEAEPGQGRKVLLSHNFRSGIEVIECVNDVFRVCMSPSVGGLHYGEAEQLREGVPHTPFAEPAVELYAVETEKETYAQEAAFVAERIRKMLDSRTLVRNGDGWRPVEPEDIVILLRSPGSAGGYFQRALEAKGIRCSAGGGTNLLHTQEVATVCALLRTILNPRQDIPLLSVLASPVFGFTADDLARFRSEQRQGCIYDALLRSDTPKAAHFLTTLQTLRDLARMEPLSVLLERCFAMTRLDSIYGAMADGALRRENLQTFYSLAADFEKGSARDLSQFLEYLDTLEDRGLITATGVPAGCVSIMSIHKSKGLEFPVVFLCNLARKFNQEDMRGQILCDRTLGLGLSVADRKNRVRYPSLAKRAISAKMAAQSVSEELRVLYVAMTRARDRLIMTYASQTMESDLEEIALRKDLDDGALLAREAICLGDWVLLAAMGRTEAGALHAIGGRPEKTRLSEYPWRIAVVQGPGEQTAPAVCQDAPAPVPDGLQAAVRGALEFAYPHLAATQVPSKQTATGRKGREKDAEAAENAPQSLPAARGWRKPSFLTAASDAVTLGNATHGAMQYLRYDRCGSPESVRQELDRLTESGFLTAQQAEMVNERQIATFFQSEIGCKLRSGVPHLREFKFSILDDATRYGDNLEGEQVLLQGVVDCALLEEEGITILDFKTDAVTPETVAARAEEYRMQVQTYAEALSRIYEMPVAARYLYFFRLNRFVKL